MGIEAELQARFAVRVERFEHRDVALEMLLPLAPEELIDEEEFQRDERLPYWAELWPSALGLARHLLEGAPPAGRVLELGAGVALPSLVLHARRVEVLATDYYADALLFARANAERNGLPPLATALLDWRAPDPGAGRFDLVLAADVLYERRNAEALATALPPLLAPGGALLLADPGRVYLGEFRTLMEKAGWTIAERELREEVMDASTGRGSKIQILELRKQVPPLPLAGEGVKG